MKQQDIFFDQQPEPIKGCLIALRQIILDQDPSITPAWKYGMPFFCFKGKMFCYLWVDKNSKLPYLGIVEGKHIEHPLLVGEKRSRMKIIRFDPNKDLPLKTIKEILQKAISLYRSGLIKSNG